MLILFYYLFGNASGYYAVSIYIRSDFTLPIQSIYFFSKQCFLQPFGIIKGIYSTVHCTINWLYRSSAVLSHGRVAAGSQASKMKAGNTICISACACDRVLLHVPLFFCDQVSAPNLVQIVPTVSFYIADNHQGVAFPKFVWAPGNLLFKILPQLPVPRCP